ncbi:hypothetical protein [Sphingomonas morindae]|uniref:Uncharacterized protein n=1 Tax=Sphingomonas morindae TaxID=1541170 RepID=A0ABY4X654_9SPHN|nr:hypothetical protein [Sphingomonas morindae]USI72388.1 hypothetical protein LHA26_13965 [Sphingomonas morindae]
MIRILAGSIAGGIVMFVVSFLFWATPLAGIGYAHVDDQRSAAVQTALAQNLPATGRYVVPDTRSAAGTILYGRGPVATIDYNSHGFATNDGGALLGGLIQDMVVVLLFGLALVPILSRVTDFASRARVVIGIAAAAAVMIQLADPIYAHGSWRFALYALIADIAMLAAGALVLTRWFLPYATDRERTIRR